MLHKICSFSSKLFTGWTGAMVLHFSLLLLVLGQANSQWLSFNRGPNSDKLWMPNMPTGRGGPRSHGRFQTPAPTLRPPVMPPASPTNRQRALAQQSQQTNTVGGYDGQPRGHGPQAPSTRNYVGQNQNFGNGRNQNSGKIPLPPQPRVPAPAPQQASQPWGIKTLTQQQPPPQQQQQRGNRDQKTDSSSPAGSMSQAPGNRGLNWQGPLTHNNNQNLWNQGNQVQQNSREPRPISQQPGQLHDSWPNSITHHHLTPVGQAQQNKNGRPNGQAAPPHAPPQSWPTKIRLSNTPLQMAQTEAPKKPKAILESDVYKSHLSPQQKEKIIQMTNTLTKLSPKKPINVFMRQEGIAATRAGADVGEVIKKYAGGSKVPFFNGTLPYNNLPTVFLAPEDMTPPYGYGKIPIPSLKKESKTENSAHVVQSSVTVGAWPTPTAMSRSDTFRQTSFTTNNPFLASATMAPPPGYTKILLPPGASGQKLSQVQSQQLVQGSNTKTLSGLSADQKVKILNMLQGGQTKVMGMNPQQNFAAAQQSFNAGRQINNGTKYQTGYKIIKAPRGEDGSSLDPYQLLRDALPPGAIVESIQSIGQGGTGGDSVAAGSISSPSRIPSPFDKITGYNGEGVRPTIVRPPAPHPQQARPPIPNPQQPGRPQQTQFQQQQPQQGRPNQGIQQQHQLRPQQIPQNVFQQYPSNVVNQNPQWSQKQHQQGHPFQQNIPQSNPQRPPQQQNQQFPQQQPNQQLQQQQPNHPFAPQHPNLQFPQQQPNQPIAQRPNQHQRPQQQAPAGHSKVVVNPPIQISMPSVQDGGLNENELQKIIGQIVQGEPSTTPNNNINNSAQQRKPVNGVWNQHGQQGQQWNQQTQQRPNGQSAHAANQQNGNTQQNQGEWYPQQSVQSQQGGGQFNNMQGQKTNVQSQNGFQNQQQQNFVYPQGGQQQQGSNQPHTVVFPQDNTENPIHLQKQTLVFPQGQGPIQSLYPTVTPKPQGPPHNNQRPNNRAPPTPHVRAPVHIPAPTPPTTQGPMHYLSPSPPPTNGPSSREQSQEHGHNQPYRQRPPYPPHPPKPRNPLQTALSFLGIQSTPKPELIMGKPPQNYPNRNRPRPPTMNKKQDSHPPAQEEDSASSESNQREVEVEAPPSLPPQQPTRQTVVVKPPNGSKERRPTIVITGGDGDHMPDIRRIINSLNEMENSKSEESGVQSSPTPKPASPSPSSYPSQFQSSTQATFHHSTRHPTIPPFGHAPTAQSPHPNVLTNQVPLSPVPSPTPFVYTTPRPTTIFQQSTPGSPFTIVSSTPPYLSSPVRPLISSTPFLMQNPLRPFVSSTPATYLVTNQSPGPILLQTPTPRPQLLNLQGQFPTATPQQFLIHSPTGVPQLVTIGGNVSPASLHYQAVQNAIRQNLGLPPNPSPTPFLINPSTPQLLSPTPQVLPQQSSTPTTPSLITNSASQTSGSESVNNSPEYSSAGKETSESSRSPPKKASSEEFIHSKSSKESSSGLKSSKGKESAFSKQASKESSERGKTNNRQRNKDQSSEEEIIEKVRTEEKIIWNGQTPSKIRTEERTIIRPHGHTSTHTTTHSKNDRESSESVRHEDRVKYPYQSVANSENKERNKESSIFRPSMSLDERHRIEQQEAYDHYFNPSHAYPPTSKEPQTTTEDTVEDKNTDSDKNSTSSFAGLLASKMRFEKMKEQLYPHQFFNDPNAENGTLYGYMPVVEVLPTASNGQAYYTTDTTTPTSTTVHDPNGRYKIRPKSQDMTPVSSITPASVDPILMERQHQQYAYMMSSTGEPVLVSRPAASYPYGVSGGTQAPSYYTPNAVHHHTTSRMPVTLTNTHYSTTVRPSSEEKLMFMPSSTAATEENSGKGSTNQRLVFFPSSTPAPPYMHSDYGMSDLSESQSIRSQISEDMQMIQDTPVWEPFGSDIKEHRSSTTTTQPTTTTTTTTPAPTTTTTTTTTTEPPTTTTTTTTTTAKPKPQNKYSREEEDKPVTWRPSHSPITTTANPPQPVTYSSSESRIPDVGAGTLHAMMAGISHQPVHRWQDNSHMNVRDHGASILYAIANGMPMPMMPPAFVPLGQRVMPQLQSPYNNPMLMQPHPSMSLHQLHSMPGPSQNPYLNYYNPVGPTQPAPIHNNYYNVNWDAQNPNPEAQNIDTQDTQSTLEEQTFAVSSEPSTTQHSVRYRNKYRIPVDQNGGTFQNQKKLIPVYVHKGSRRNRYRKKPVAQRTTTTTTTEPPALSDEYEDDMLIQESVAGMSDRVNTEAKPSLSQYEDTAEDYRRTNPVRNNLRRKPNNYSKVQQEQQYSQAQSGEGLPRQPLHAQYSEVPTTPSKSSRQRNSGEGGRTSQAPQYIRENEYTPLASSEARPGQYENIPEPSRESGDVEENQEQQYTRRRQRPVHQEEQTTTTTTTTPAPPSEEVLYEVRIKGPSAEKTKRKLSKFASGSDEQYDDYEFSSPSLMNLNFKPKVKTTTTTTTTTPLPRRRKGSRRRTTTTQAPEIEESESEESPEDIKPVPQPEPRRRRPVISEQNRVAEKQRSSEKVQREEVSEPVVMSIQQVYRDTGYPGSAQFSHRAPVIHGAAGDFSQNNNIHQEITTTSPPPVYQPHLEHQEIPTAAPELNTQYQSIPPSNYQYPQPPAYPQHDHGYQQNGNGGNVAEASNVQPVINEYQETSVHQTASESIKAHQPSRKDAKRKQEENQAQRRQDTQVDYDDRAGTYESGTRQQHLSSQSQVKHGIQNKQESYPAQEPVRSSNRQEQYYNSEQQIQQGQGQKYIQIPHPDIASQILKLDTSTQKHSTESHQNPKTDQVNKDMFMVSAEESEERKLDFISAESRDPFRVGIVGSHTKLPGMSLMSSPSKDSPSILSFKSSVKSTGATIGFVDDDLTYTKSYTTSTTPPTTTTTARITTLKTVPTTTTRAPTTTAVKPTVSGGEDEYEEEELKLLLQKLQTKLQTQGLSEYDDLGDAAYDYYDPSDLVEALKETPSKSKSKTSKKTKKTKGKAKTSKSKKVATTVRPKTTKKPKTVKPTTAKPKITTPKPTKKPTAKPTTKPTLRTTTSTTTTPPTTTRTTTTTTQAPPTHSALRLNNVPIQQYRHPSSSLEAFGTTTVHPVPENKVSYILPIPTEDYASNEVKPRPRPYWIKRKINATSSNENQAPGGNPSRKIRLVRRRRPGPTPLGLVKGPVFVQSQEHSRPSSGSDITSGSSLVINPTEGTTVLPIENLFDTGLSKRFGEPEQPVRRRLKLVRKGDRAQWKLKSEDNPRVEPLVSHPQGQPGSQPETQPEKSVRMESSVRVETRVCVNGVCTLKV